MSKLKSLAGQTAIYGVSTIVGRLLNYLLVPLYTRIFSPEAYGVVSEFYVYMSFLLIIYSFGMETSFFHFSNKYPDQQQVYNNTFITLFTNAILLSGLVIILTPWLATILEYPHHWEYFFYVAAIMGLDTLAIAPFVRLRIEGKAKKFALIKVANITINIAFNLFFLLFCPYVLKTNSWQWLQPLINYVYNPDIGVGYVFISNLIASLFTLFPLWKEFMYVQFQFDLVLLRKMLIYTFPLIIVGVAGMVNETIDRILLKFLLPGNFQYRMSQMGIYSACYKLSIFMTLTIQAFRMGAEPFFFAEFHEKDAHQTYSQVMKYFVIFGSIIFLGVMLYIDVLKFIIGKNFRVGLAVVPILLLANLCLGIYYNISIWYKATERNFWGAGIAMFGATITIVLNFILIPRIGYMGAAWTTLATYFAMAVTGYFIGQRFYPVPYPVLKMVTYIGLALLLFYVSVLFRNKVMHTSIYSGSINIPTLLFNTLLMILFIAYFLIREKPDFILNSRKIKD